MNIIKEKIFASEDFIQSSDLTGSLAIHEGGKKSKKSSKKNGKRSASSEAAKKKGTLNSNIQPSQIKTFEEDKPKDEDTE